MKKWLVISDKITRMKEIFFKGSILLFLALFLSANLVEAFNCNIQTLKETYNSEDWSYLWSVTSLCGVPNANNLSAHMNFLNIDPSLEYRAIAKQTEDTNLNRFFIIIVSGRRDNFTDNFIPETLILEIANLQYPTGNTSAPFDQLETGFFIIKAELNGDYLEGFQIENGNTRRLGNQFAQDLMEYIRQYWQEYFDSVIFVEADNELSQ